MLPRSFPALGLTVLTSLIATAPFVQASEPRVLPSLSNPSPPQNYRVPILENAHLVLNLTQRQVTLFRGNQMVRRYPVAVGKPGWETPTGRFQVKTKVRNPPWKSPFNGAVIPAGHPRNPLGQRWIGFWTNGKNWIGFHGTPNRGSVGTAASHGCVRMYDEDINELFERVTVGTPIMVKR